MQQQMTPEVRRALELGTAAVQEAQATAARDKKDAIEAAVMAERQRWERALENERAAAHDAHAQHRGPQHPRDSENVFRLVVGLIERGAPVAPPFQSLARCVLTRKDVREMKTCKSRLVII